MAGFLLSVEVLGVWNGLVHVVFIAVSASLSFQTFMKTEQRYHTGGDIIEAFHIAVEWVEEAKELKQLIISGALPEMTDAKCPTWHIF